MDRVFRALAALGILSSIAWVFLFQKGELGFRAYGKGSLQYVAARTSPFSLVLSALGIGLLFVLMRNELRIGDFQAAPLWRRYAALLIDFWFVVYVFANLSAMIPLIVEAVRENSFQWHFERDYWLPSDWTLIVLILAAIIAIVAYFVLPLTSRRQTFGGWMLGIATVSSDGSVVSLPLPIAFRFKYWEFSELFSPFSVWGTMKRRDAQRRTPFEREMGLMVVHYSDLAD
ncbi:MAG TPA: RDD family protein [Candidatus Sulfotelmatobacter sp.]|nr:RDD family protein [Candidatus Sulfotelmatobacter sp.]